MLSPKTMSSPIADELFEEYKIKTMDVKFLRAEIKGFALLDKTWREMDVRELAKHADWVTLRVLSHPESRRLILTDLLPDYWGSVTGLANHVALLLADHQTDKAIKILATAKDGTTAVGCSVRISLEPQE